MTRKPTGKARGRPTRVKGSKLTFLESFKDQYLENSDPGAFYTMVTSAWLEKYGYDLPFDDEPPPAPPAATSTNGLPKETPPEANTNTNESSAVAPQADINVDEPPPPNADPLPIEEQMAEKERQANIKKDLRTRLGNWFRNKYNKKKTDNLGIAEILNAMLSIAAVRPRKKSALSLYTQLHYQNKLKARFDAIWDGIKNSVVPEARISMCQEFVRRCWERESAEFRKEIEDRVAQEYTDAMTAYKAKGSWAGTTEGYQQAWDTIDDVLPPFVDAIAKWMGMSASLMLVGPVGSEGGNMLLRSVHSETTSGLTPLIWPKYDPAGFSLAQESIVKYGHAFFSPQTCLERVPGFQSEGATTPDSNDEGPSASGAGDNSTTDSSLKLNTSGPEDSTTYMSGSLSEFLHANDNELSWTAPGLDRGFNQYNPSAGFLGDFGPASPPIPGFGTQDKMTFQTPGDTTASGPFVFPPNMFTMTDVPLNAGGVTQDFLFPTTVQSTLPPTSMFHQNNTSLAIGQPAVVSGGNVSLTSTQTMPFQVAPLTTVPPGIPLPLTQRNNPGTPVAIAQIIGPQPANGTGAPATSELNNTSPAFAITTQATSLQTSGLSAPLTAQSQSVFPQPANTAQAGVVGAALVSFQAHSTTPRLAPAQTLQLTTPEAGAVNPTSGSAAQVHSITPSSAPTAQTLQSIVPEAGAVNAPLGPAAQVQSTTPPSAPAQTIQSVAPEAGAVNGALAPIAQAHSTTLPSTSAQLAGTAPGTLSEQSATAQTISSEGNALATSSAAAVPPTAPPKKRKKPTPKPKQAKRAKGNKEPVTGSEETGVIRSDNTGEGSGGTTDNTGEGSGGTTDSTGEGSGGTKNKAASAQEPEPAPATTRRTSKLPARYRA